MTDWTSDENSKKSDDEFYEWLDRDKENYNRKHKKSSKQKIAKKNIFLIFIGVISVIVIFLLLNNMINSEQYFYISDYRLNKIPLFCAQDFEDPLFPNANDLMMKKTNLAISDWQEKVRTYTKNTDWKFEFKIIPDSENKGLSNLGCDATITFERLPPRNQEGLRGETAISRYGLSDVVVFYLEPTGKNIDPDIDFVLKHEIGHVFGLDHPLLDAPFTIDIDGVKTASSVMITPEIYPNLTSDIVYDISDYDVRALVNLYGGGISNTPIFFGYLNYIILALILFVVAFFVNKKLKQS